MFAMYAPVQMQEAHVLKIKEGEDIKKRTKRRRDE